MRLNEIEYQGFRNLVDGKLSFSSDYNFIIGDNGAGKTNLLEAIFYAGIGSSFRPGEEKCLIGFGQQYLRITARTDARSASIYLGTDGKRMTIQGRVVKRLSDFVGWLGITFLSIEDIWLIRGAAARRRSFLNWAIGKFMPSHLLNLIEYKKILRQRNKFLQDMRKDESCLPLLETYDEELVNYGNKIYDALKINLSDFKQKIKEIGCHLGLKDLSVDYHSTCPDMRMTKDMFRNIRKKERELGLTLIGPHRDDLWFFLDKRPLKTYASEGEERLASLALKLTEAEILNEKTGKRPLLLLDEIATELDFQNQQSLFKLLKGQIFYASTAMPQYNLGENYRQFVVRGGRIEVS